MNHSQQSIDRMFVSVSADSPFDVLPLARAFKDQEYSPIKHAVALLLRQAYAYNSPLTEWWWSAEFDRQSRGPRGVCDFDKEVKATTFSVDMKEQDQ